MSTATIQSLPLRMRRDLVVERTTYDHQSFWVVKDPVASQFFQLRDEEYFVLSSLDGQASGDSIRQAFDDRFAPSRLGERQLRSYLGMLHGQGLVVADVAGQGQALLDRRHRRWRARLLGGITSILAIRFRGIDPERFLRWLAPMCRWCFSAAFFVATIMLAVAALALIAVQYETMLARLPSFHAFFNVGNLLWIAAALGVVKVLHELGHALACKHFGGECHEMGVMLLVFTPCLYCNVSDAWMMKNKWHRMAISAAGMWVEIVIASICTFLWWFSEPGLFNAICLNLVFVCSVSTVLFNGNPLLRYDGYYILADWLEVPNMRTQASSLLTNALGRICLGVDRSSRALPQRRRRLLMTYAVASLVYRTIVIIAILWFLYAWLRPLGLQIVAQIIMAIMVGGLVLVPLWRFARFVLNAIKAKELDMVRTKITVVVVVIAVLLACLIPLPRQVSAPAVVQPKEAIYVFVNVTGRLPIGEHWAKPGQGVKRNEVLVQLKNETIDKEIAKLEGQVAVLKQRTQSLSTIRVQDSVAGNRLPTVNEALRNAQRQLQRRIEDRQRLTIRAPAEGIILPPTSKAKTLYPGQLLEWSGSPLDRRNAGCTIQSGTPFCLIGDPEKLEALLVVDQSKIDNVQIGQTVRMRFAQMPGKTLSGVITEIAENELESAPQELAKAGNLAVVTDESGITRPVDTSFHVRVEIDSVHAGMLLRTTGQARVSVQPQSLATRIYRFLVTTFRF